MIFTNLRRHRVRTAIGATGIALGVATMLSVVGLLGGAVKMFERILRSDSQMVVFEKNVSDLFFSNVPVEVAAELDGPAILQGGAAGAVHHHHRAGPAGGHLLRHPRHRSAASKKATWLQGRAADFHR